MMISLAYFSSATAPMTSADLNAMIERARRNNTEKGVTGMLCHHDGSFLQFLEGPENAVDETFARIRRDSRHRQVLEVHRRPIDHRAFADWSMAVVKVGDVSPEHQAFSKSLREVEIPADAGHRAEIDGFLQSFKAWLR